MPVGLAAIVAGRRFLPHGAPATAGARLDAPSVLLAMVGCVALVYPLIQGREHGWPAWSFVMIAVGVGTLGVFAALQARRSRQGRARSSNRRSCAGAPMSRAWRWCSASSARWGA